MLYLPCVTFDIFNEGAGGDIFHDGLCGCAGVTGSGAGC